MILLVQMVNIMIEKKYDELQIKMLLDHLAEGSMSVDEICILLAVQCPTGHDLDKFRHALTLRKEVVKASFDMRNRGKKKAECFD